MNTIYLHCHVYRSLTWSGYTSPSSLYQGDKFTKGSMHLNCTTPQRPLSQPLATLIDSHYQHLVLGHRCPILLSSVLMFQNIIHVRITTFYKSGQSASTHLVLHILRSVSESIFIVYVSTFTRKLFATFIGLLLIWIARRFTCWLLRRVRSTKAVRKAAKELGTRQVRLIR